MRKSGVLLSLMLGAALCAGGRVEAATGADVASPVVAATPTTTTQPFRPARPSAFAMGAALFAGFVVAYARRRRAASEFAAL